MQKANAIDEFISQFPAKHQKLIQSLRPLVCNELKNQLTFNLMC